MFGTLSAMSRAQHEQLDALFAEAEGRGLTVNGVLVDNGVPVEGERGTARFVLVIDDTPQTNSGEWDRLYGFEGNLIASGEGIVELLNTAFSAAVLGSLSELGDIPLAA